jgi:photosystem II stability/assembly factor-like uncharacterized protein
MSHPKAAVEFPLPHAAQETEQDGIVYFSYDNGNNWVNASNGLPEKISIGLGGMAASRHFLGVATKDNGVYRYNIEAKIWQNIPTDKQIIEANIGALAFMDSTIFVGTQLKGVFCTKDKGKNWTSLNAGLTNLTIRRFCVFNQVLYVCTNDGFYALNDLSDHWLMAFGQPSLQTNGATLYQGNFYLATNKGVFSQQKDKSWIHSSPQYSLHNISSDENQLYAMTYDELLLSSTDGKSWQNLQSGLPKALYTFNILNHHDVVLAGQWDGIYRKTDSNPIWELSSNGLPTNFAVTNLQAFNQIVVISTAERKLKAGMSVEK